MGITYQSPVFNSNMLGPIVRRAGSNGSRNLLTIQSVSSRPSYIQESRSQICMRSDSIQSLILADTRASDDERNVYIGFYKS